MANDTHITTDGRILKQGDASGDLVVYDATGTVAMLRVSEVSDDETLFLFLKAGEDTSGIFASDGDTVFDPAKGYEIMANSPQFAAK